jgi:GntR family transcriptional repressor for pyruvate dehydrogenase complex
MEDLSLHEIVRTNAAEAVRTQLIRLIESRELVPGQKLPAEHELARRFGVSRPVVREALGTLSAIGMIATRSGSGSFVADGGQRPLLLGEYSFEELHEARTHLEVPGAGLAAQRGSEGDLRLLADTIEGMLGITDPERWVEQDVAFHDALARAAGNKVQMLLIDRLRDLLREQSIAVVRHSNRIENANREHTAIYQAVAARKPDAAKKAMTVHLLNVYNL